jgi:hypothetical protein
MDESTVISLMAKTAAALVDDFSDDESLDKEVEITPNYGAMNDFDRETHLQNLESDFTKYRQEYERCYDCRIVQIPRRKEDTGWLSFMSYSTKTLVEEDSRNFIDDLRQIEEENVDRQTPLNLHVFIDTVGGSLSTAEVICKAMLQYPGRIRVYVGNKAMSAGTLIALCGHEIHLRRYAHLGQIDPQIGSYWAWVPANSIETAHNKIREFETSWVRDLLRAGMGPAQDANTRVVDLVNRISEVRRWSQPFKQRLCANLMANFLSGGYGHDRPIDYDDLQKFWNDEEENMNVEGDETYSIPPLYPDWPRSAKFLSKKPDTPDTPPPKNSYLSAFGL